MEFFEVVNSRKSYRGQFTDKQLTDNEKELILKAGLSAPSGMNKPTTHYIAVSDREIILQMAGIFKRYGFETAPFVIVVLTKDRSSETGQDFSVENYSASVENIQLAVTALGYDTVWTDGVVRNPLLNVPLRKLLNVDDKFTIKCVFPIGESAEKTSKHASNEIKDYVEFI